MLNFDLPIPNGYAGRARAHVKARYGHRVTVVDGKSRETIPQYAASHPRLRCDLVVVDGDHTYASTLQDLVALLQFAPCNASVLLDDVCDVRACHAHVTPALAALSMGFKNGSNHPSVVGPTMAWHEAVRTGHVAPVRTWFESAEDRGWVLGRHVCDADGRPKPMQPAYSTRPQWPVYRPDRWSPRVTSAVKADWKAAEKLWGTPRANRTGGHAGEQSQPA